MCMRCVQVPKETKRTLDPLGLELQVAVSRHVGTGNQTLVL